MLIKRPALIAQLDRAFGYGPKGWEFESLWVHQKSNRNAVAFFCNFFVLDSTKQTAQKIILNIEIIHSRFVSFSFAFYHIFCQIAYTVISFIVPFSIFEIVLLVLLISVYQPKKV